MHHEIISVIIPVYNTEIYLEKCIKSVLNQFFECFEVILIDDGSTDHSGEICDTFAENYQNIRTLHVTNGGVSSARNCGINNAKGEYIVFVDSDDYIDKYMLQKLYEGVKKNNVELCLCGYTQIFTDKKLEILPQEGIYDFIGFLDLMKYWKLNCIIGSPCNKIFRKSIIEKYHIRFKDKMDYAEDYLFNITYLKYVNTIRVIGKSYYNYYTARTNSLSKTNYLNPDILWKNQVHVYKEINNLLLAHQIEANYHNVLGDIICNMLSINFLQRLKKYGLIKSTLWLKSLYDNNLINVSLKNTKKISQVKGLKYIYKYIRFSNSSDDLITLSRLIHQSLYHWCTIHKAYDALKNIQAFPFYRFYIT